MRIAPLTLTEEAQKLLRATHADFSRISTPVVSGRGGSYISSPLGQHDFVQVRHQSELLRLVTIVEAYVDTCSAQQFDHRTSGRDAFVRDMATEVRETSLRGWEERKDAFKRYHGVTLGDCAGWSDIDAAREIRNSIAHGLGQLTARQQNTKTRRKMEAIGVRFRGDQLVLDAATLERCLKSAVAFIRDVDRCLPRWT